MENINWTEELWKHFEIIDTCWKWYEWFIRLIETQTSLAREEVKNEMVKDQIKLEQEAYNGWHTDGRAEMKAQCLAVTKENTFFGLPNDFWLHSEIWEVFCKEHNSILERNNYIADWIIARVKRERETLRNSISSIT
jgi:hypothetical protein